MHRAILSIVVATFSLPLQLEGAVFERDFIVPGDGLLTYDNVNHREWLDLTETVGVDLATVLEWMAPGGKLEGFSFALLEDVEALAFSAGVDWMYPWSLPTPPGHESEALTMLLGPVNDVMGIKVSLGLVAIGFSDDEPLFDDTNLIVMCVTCTTEPLPFGAMHTVVLEGIFTTTPISAEYLDGSLPGAGDIGPFWLYRVAVPEPSSFVLLVVGVVVSCGRRCAI